MKNQPECSPVKDTFRKNLQRGGGRTIAGTVVVWLWWGFSTNSNYYGGNMLKLLGRLLWILIWGLPKKPTQSPVPPVPLGSNAIQRFTFGHATVQIFLNHSRTGKPYYKLQFQRLVNDGRNRSNSFFVEDLADVERCIIRARAWMHDSKVVE